LHRFKKELSVFLMYKAIDRNPELSSTSPTPFSRPFLQANLLLTPNDLV
jgi:hypothetical protein